MTPATKLQGHVERAASMAQCLPPWLWIDDDGTPEGWIFWAEMLDGLATLVAAVGES